MLLGSARTVGLAAQDQNQLKVAGPVPYPGMQRWLQAVFNARISDDDLYAIRQLGCDGIRIDAQELMKPADVAVLADDALRFGLTPLVIVKDAWQIADLPPGSHVEVRNEPDIDTNEKLSPKDYAEIAHRCVTAAHRRSEEVQSLIPVWVGAVSNLNDRGLAYMRMLFSDRIPNSLLSLPPDVGVSVHRYAEDTVWKPHDHFTSREHEVEVLRKIIGSRAYGVSEMGYSTGAVDNKPGLTDEEARDNLRQEFNFWPAQGAKFCTVYQLNDGPENAPLDKYGIRRIDGTWKPSADIFR